MCNTINHYSAVCNYIFAVLKHLTCVLIMCLQHDYKKKILLPTVFEEGQAIALDSIAYILSRLDLSLSIYHEFTGLRVSTSSASALNNGILNTLIKKNVDSEH